VHTMRSKVTKFQRRLWTETLLDGTTPLLHILRRRVELPGKFIEVLASRSDA